MARKTAGGESPFDPAAALVRAWETNDRISRYLIENLDDAAWRAAPPGGKGRTIAAVAAHMHNVRVMWLKATRAATVPEQLNRAEASRADAIQALTASGAALAEVLAQSARSDGRVRGFKPDVAGFLGYLVSHDAHHRGQIATLARQVGFPLAQKVMFGMWEWGSR